MPHAIQRRQVDASSLPLVCSFAIGCAIICASWSVSLQSSTTLSFIWSKTTALERQSALLDVFAYLFLVPIAMTASPSPLVTLLFSSLSYGAKILCRSPCVRYVVLKSKCYFRRRLAAATYTTRFSQAVTTHASLLPSLQHRTGKSYQQHDYSDNVTTTIATPPLPPLRRAGELQPLDTDSAAAHSRVTLCRCIRVRKLWLHSVASLLLHLEVSTVLMYEFHVYALRKYGRGVDNTTQAVSFFTQMLGDIIVLLAAAIVVAFQLCRSSAHLAVRLLGLQQNTRYGEAVRKVCVWLVPLTCVCLSMYAVWQVQNFDSQQHLRRGILTDDVDACAAEGLRMTPAVRKSWAWLVYALSVIRVVDARISCTTAGWQSTSFVDGATSTLVVSATCVNGQPPHVFVEWPYHNMLSFMHDNQMPRDNMFRTLYNNDLELLYGETAKADTSTPPLLLVHRNKSTRGYIGAIEIHPDHLRTVHRTPRTAAERAARASWPSSEVFEVALGRSPQYTVYCDATGVREVHLFPLNASFDAGSFPITATEAAESTTNTPVANILILLFDAVSRQEVPRSLPRFTAWMRKFQQAQRARPQHEQHVLYEAKAYTTVGLNTMFAVNNILNGVDPVTMQVSKKQWSDMQMHKRTILSSAKRTHGASVDIAFSSSYCGDLFADLMYHVVGSGRGGRTHDVDHYLFQPYCDNDYGYHFGNLQGPYSIKKRCIGATQVHELELNYTMNLLRMQMRQRKAALLELQRTGYNGSSPSSMRPRGVNFLNLAYFLEGHEVTHNALRFVDESLTRFMDELLHELHYFDDPHNMFLFLSDHGNHMGHYAYSVAGHFEHTTPAFLFVAHRSMFARLDARKGRIDGTSEATFYARMQRLVTPRDVYMTLADLLAVTPHNDNVKPPLALTYASLFDTRADDSYVRQCSQYRKAKDEACLLLYCT